MAKHKVKAVQPYSGAWAGSEESYAEYLTLLRDFNVQASSMSAEESGGDEPSYLYSRYGNVGVISVNGTLLSKDSMFTKVFGMTTYPEIKRAVINALEDTEVDRILLDIDSPGGAAFGVDTAIDSLKQANELKPVFAHASGMMCSGAYWIGSAAQEISASRASQIGSIGVIMTHMEYTKQLEMAGVTATVIRAGKYKQMGNPYETLTEEGKAELQSQADGIYRMFVSDVSEARGKTYDYTDQYMAQGRVFMADNAVQVGLVDKLSSFEEILLEISAKKLDKKQTKYRITGNGDNNMIINNKKTLVSAVETALIASGALPADFKSSATQETNEAAQETAVVVDAATAEKAALSAEDNVEVSEAALAQGTTLPDATGQAEPEVTAELKETTVDVSAYNALQGANDLLKAQLSDVSSQLVESKVEIKTLQTELEGIQVATEGLVEIAAKSINAMQVALGGAATTLTGMSAKEVLNLHTQVSADFKKNFKVGGVAAVAPSTNQETKVDLSVTSADQAKLAATRLR